MRRSTVRAFALCILPLAARADEISVAGRDRSYEIYRPETLDRALPAPLVIMLHGGFGTGEQARRSYGWDAAAKAKGFVVAYPDGVRRSWNAGGDCCGPSRRDAVDDVGFLTALIRKVSAEQTIDPARIYLTGISNGAAMAYRYACDGAVPIAAIASISGAMPGGCPNPHAVSVLEIHGLQDRNIPFAGGKGSKGVTGIDWPPVEAGLDAFRKADQCGAGERRAEGAVVTIRAACAMGREVRLITIADAGHQWPGSTANRPLAQLLLDVDPPSKALDATAVAWDFFQNHPRP
jgi:polyhydroxybutyrate depolymerase